MIFPESEKFCPTFRQSVLLGALLLGIAPTVLAGAEEDYRSGLAAYTAGNLVGAMAPLKRSADTGYAPAEALYGDILDKAESNEEAVQYLKRAAEKNNADGMYTLGVMTLAGEGIPKNPTEASRLFRQAARQGHAQAINALAEAYLRKDAGLGADTTDSEDARTYLLQAAEQGYVPAAEALAKAYASGGFGLAPDARKAKEWAARVSKYRGDTRKPGRSS